MQLFDELPCAVDFRVTIEEHEGQYGWTDSEDGDDEESPKKKKKKGKKSKKGGNTKKSNPALI